MYIFFHINSYISFMSIVCNYKKKLYQIKVMGKGLQICPILSIFVAYESPTHGCSAHIALLWGFLYRKKLPVIDFCFVLQVYKKPMP